MTKPLHPGWRRSLQINPHYGNAYAIAGHFFIINRRYEEGIAHYRKALDLDPTLNSSPLRYGREPDAPGPRRGSAQATGTSL